MTEVGKQTGLAPIGLAVGVIVAVGLALYSYLLATARPLHPNPRDVPSNPCWIRGI